MPTARERAYQKIRTRILDGTFPPGYQLKEEELAGEYGVSRTPIRQAIQQLVDDGLVTVRENRRSHVSDVNESQFEELFDLLAFLESYSAGLAAVRIPAGALAELREISAQMGRVVRESPDANREFLDLNSRFHKTIHRASGNDKLYGLIQRIIEFPHNLYLKFGQINSAHNPRSLVQHEQILDALSAHDRDLASLCMRMHTESVRRSFRELWADWEQAPRGEFIAEAAEAPVAAQEAEPSRSTGRLDQHPRRRSRRQRKRA
jgi:DNA-binding GntR family transcriptional regulator